MAVAGRASRASLEPERELPAQRHTVKDYFPNTHENRETRDIATLRGRLFTSLGGKRNENFIIFYFPNWEHFACSQIGNMSYPVMRVIAWSKLVAYYGANPNAKVALTHWHAIAKAADWASMNDVQTAFANARVPEWRARTI